MNNYQKLRQVIAGVFYVKADTINENTSHETLEMWDSIHQMNLIFALEEAFEIQLSDEEVVQLLTFKQIKNILEEREIVF